MRYWNTGDTPTNSNLSSLENLAHPWAGIDAERLLDVIRGVIRIEKMLPKAVRHHFKLPPLIVGAGPYDWDAARRDKYHSELCEALSAGLAGVQADPSLAKDGGADLSDRPPTRGEELEFACRALICPLLSGPKLMIFWITKETRNAEQEASPGRDYRQAA